MMFRFPFYGYPYNYNYNYYKYYNQLGNSSTIKQEKSTAENVETNEDKIEEENQKEKSSITNSRKISSTTDAPIFEIFGIKLYLDDLIIIGVMYFLYQQNVHDEMLYLILLMLLFS